MAAYNCIENICRTHVHRALHFCLASTSLKERTLVVLEVTNATLITDLLNRNEYSNGKSSHFTIVLRLTS